MIKDLSDNNWHQVHCGSR